jgi:transposase
MKCKRETDGRAFDHTTLQQMRQQAVKAVRSGMPVKEVALAFGMNTRTVFRWLAAFVSGGQNALQAKEIPGRPPLLTEEEMRWIARAVREQTPQQFKFEFGLWTLSLIGHLIQRQFGKKLSRATVQRAMKALGFSVQKPLYQAWQQDPVLVREWEQQTWPAIRAEAKAAGASLYFGDEAGMRSDHHTGATWAPVGETPVVEATGRRFSLNMISAVGTRGEFRFMLHEGTVNAPVFLEFLKRLLVGAEHPVFLVVDGHPMHKSRQVRSFIEEQHGRLKLFYLPPYSPQLNPDEVVWAHVKRRVSRQIIQNMQDMKKQILGALRHIQKCPALVKSFFQQPECQYII